MSTDPGEAVQNKQPVDGETEPDDPAPTENEVAGQETRRSISPRELEDQQLDVANEAREVETALTKLPKATDLAKERIATAAKAAEEAAGALGTGANDNAQKSIHEAGGMFRELAEQVRALLEEEQAQQIAAAQQMAAELARRQLDFRDKLANAGEGGGIGKPRPEDDQERAGLSEEERKRRDDEEKRAEEERKVGLGGAAEDIAEKAKTLADVLAAASGSDKPEDQAAADKLKALAGEIDLAAVVERLQQLPDQVGSGKEEDAKANAGDGAERMEAAAERLAALHRVIVTPRIDELAKVDERVAALSEELDELDTETKVGGWHNDANDLLEDLEKAGLDDKLRQEFQEEMKKVGWGNTQTRKDNWVVVDGLYRAPDSYRLHLSRLQSAVQGRMQELMLGDLINSGDEPIPPQYQDFVDKYYQVLSRRAGNRNRGTARSPERE